MGPTILLRQDRDFEKAVKYCFLQVQPQVELSRDNRDGKFTSLSSSLLLLFSSILRIHFSSLRTATLQETITANNN
jgi:hypothetical protein